MNPELLLLPSPRHLVDLGTPVYLPASGNIGLGYAASKPQLRADMLRIAQGIQQDLAAYGAQWEIAVNPVGTVGAYGLLLELAPACQPRPESYQLVISATGMVIQAADAAGAFHGAMTLRQILRQVAPGTSLPGLRIDDAPDFPNRGVMLDISRDKVPTVATLKSLIDLLGELKYNQLQLYTEHTFAYRNHQVVWQEASPLTAQDILELDQYCRERYIELVPNQNSFGHFERWLKHEPYAPLAESPNRPITLSPVEPGAMALLDELYSELLPHFTSGQFNVGCDETWDLGEGKSKPNADARGKGRVYLEFLLRIHQLVNKHGRTMQFWGDIIMQHPELIPELPPGIIAMEWGYEANQPPAEECAEFQAAGVPFYVCPGSSSWNCLLGRTANAKGNLALAAKNGLQHGAIGYLVTDWGDNGHWQYLPVSYYGFAYGAAVSWAVEVNRELDMARALDVHVFKDRAGIMGQLAMELGDVHPQTGVLVPNSAILWWFLFDPNRDLNNSYGEKVTIEGLKKAEEYLRQRLPLLEQVKLDRSDGELIVEEYKNNIAMALHGARVGQARLAAPERDATKIDQATKDKLAQERQEIIERHKKLWLARNGEGGLKDSVAKLEQGLRISQE